MIARAVLACALFALAGRDARAADLPKDISEDARAAVVKKWQANYTAARAKLMAQADEAETLAKLPATAAEGKRKLADAKALLARIDKDHTAVPVPVTFIINERPVKEGVIGIVEAGEFVGSMTADGVLVEGVLVNDKRVVRYLIASPFPLPKPKAKKDPPVSLAGAWYIAGTTEMKGKAVPVLYRFEIKKTDIPSEK